MMLTPRLAALAALLYASSLLAQEPHPHGAGEQLGSVRFPTSCPAEVQPDFQRAMALLHSFWWDQAKTAFQDLTRRDSTCAMALWGLALTHWNNPFAGGPSGNDLEAGAMAAERASQLGAPTQRERDYLAAVAALYRDHATVPNARRLRAYSDLMETTYRNHPGDPEAAIYYALSLVATASPTDTTFERQKRANEILNPLLAAHPDHPGLAHYIIHANDSPRLARYGLDAARRYASIAPSVPHAQHMPSHIFIRLGHWDENIAANRRSYEAGVAYAKAHFPDALGGHEFHAMDYMVYGYLQRGQDTAALEWIRHALGVTKVVPAGTLISEYARAAMPARYALERGVWAEAAALAVRDAPPAARMVTSFARGIGAARSGNVTQAAAEMAALAAIERQLAEPDPYWSRVAGIKRRAVGAWHALASGDTALAVREAGEAADVEDLTEKHPVTPGEVLPARELYGDLLFQLGRYAEARRAYEATLQREPGRARATFGAARAAELMGDLTAARQRYREFLELMAEADGTRPEPAMARRVVGR